VKNLILAAALVGASSFSAFADPIFNGKDLTGWTAKGPAELWTAKDGVLTGKSNEKKQGSVLWTDAKFKDFVLEGDFKYNGKIDSGFFLRSEVDQIQIGISGSLKRDMTCSPYIAKTGKYPVEAKGIKEALKIGDWNHVKITVTGNVYTIELNGTKVLDYTSETSVPEGPIGLQVHPGVDMQIEFRNLTVVPVTK
jgi:hypothetical protein